MEGVAIKLLGELMIKIEDQGNKIDKQNKLIDDLIQRTVNDEYTATSAAKYLNMSPTTLRKICDKKKITFFWKGSHRRFHRRHLVEYQEQNNLIATY